MCAAGAVLALVMGCDPNELLQVDNPEEIQEEALNDVALLDVQVNGVVDAFQNAYDDPVLEFSQYLTDEVLTGLNWEGHARVNQRVVSYLEGPTATIFEQPSRGLRMGNDVAERIRVWATEDPATDFSKELATSLVFAGYSAVVLGETMCQGVISHDPDNPSGTVLEQPDIFAAAIPYLEEAASIAVAAGEDDIANLARTGLARAYLGRGEWSNAETWANQVTAGFEWWLEYVDISGGRNPLQNTSHGGNFTLGIHPWFTGTHPSFDGTGLAFEDDDIVDEQTDPRIQHETFDETGHNGLTRLYKLFQGLRYGDYTGETIAPSSATCPNCTGTDPDDMELLAEFDTDILLADYTEAQHHYFEALAMQGGNEAAVLQFVNDRRAVGNQAAVTLSGQALITELRNQRGKDLFMGGFRLPDLRRWTRFDAGNGPFAAGSYFPTGQHPNAQWGDYDVWSCYPIPLSEYEGNPNLQKPLDPNVPPAI
jgi:hypothetical protein